MARRTKATNKKPQTSPAIPPSLVGLYEDGLLAMGKAIALSPHLGYSREGQRVKRDLDHAIDQIRKYGVLPPTKKKTSRRKGSSGRARSRSL